MNTGLLIAIPVVLAAFGFIGVHLAVQRDEPAGMDHAVREAARWLRARLPHRTPRIRKHRRTV